MNALTIRKAASDDETQATEVDRLATADLRKVYRPTSLALKRRSEIAAKLQRVVAVLEGRIIGTVQYRIDSGQLSFLGLGVHPEYRRRGVAAALVQHLERVGLDNGCKVMLLHTVRETGNVTVFERLGFEIESQTETDLFESETNSTLVEVAMIKNLVSLPALPEPEALTLHTKRLDLLPITRNLAEAMFEVLSDPDLYTFVTGAPPADVSALASQYEFWEKRRSPDGLELWFNWALRLKGQEQLIGHVQAGVLPDHADVAWFLGAHWQHQGYATEAAQRVVDLLLSLGVRKIHASINPTHEASIRVAERLGMQRTTESSDGELTWKRVYGIADNAQLKR